VAHILILLLRFNNDLVIIAESGSQEPFLADKIQMTDLNQGAQLSGIKNLGHTVQL